MNKTNGPEEEPAHNENGEEQHVDPPACPAGSPCIRVIEGLRARLRRLQDQLRQHRTASTFALSRREAACEKKDSEIKKLKGCLEIQESKAEAKLDAARARAEARRRKEVGQAQASYVKLQLESSKQIETLKSSSKIQASELRHALSQLKNCQLANSKVVAQKNAAEGKLAVLSDQHQLLKSEVADKGKVLKQLLQRQDALQKKLNRQNEIKVQASVRKEELKVRQKEVELQRVESLKRKAIEVKEAEGEVKKQVHAHRAKCMKAIARNRAFLKGEEHRRNIGTSKERINQASAFQKAAAVAASQGGTFPSVGGGPDSLANYPPVWVQQTLTQMPSSASSTSTRQQPASSAQVVASPPIQVPGGYVRTRDTITGMDVYIHEGTGKVVTSVLECYKEPPPQQTQLSMHPPETPTQIASVSPETVLSAAAGPETVLLAAAGPPQRPRKIRKLNHRNRHNPIDLCCSDSGISSGEDESPEIVYGKSEAQHDKELPLGQDPEDKDDEGDEESDSEKTTW